MSSLDGAGAAGGRRAAGEVLTEREEKNSVAIASNESFSGWTKTFTDPGSARPSSPGSPSAADLIQTGAGSYRLALAEARAAAREATAG